jgi:hypothetical protein
MFSVGCHGGHNGRRASSLGGKDYFKTLNLRQHKHHNLVQCQCLSDSTEISLSSMTWYSYSLHFRKVQWGQKLAMKIMEHKLCINNQINDIGSGKPPTTFLHIFGWSKVNERFIQMLLKKFQRKSTVKVQLIVLVWTFLPILSCTVKCA